MTITTDYCRLRMGSNRPLYTCEQHDMTESSESDQCYKEIYSRRREFHQVKMNFAGA